MDKISDKFPQIELSTIGALAGEITSLASIFDDGYFSLVELGKDTIGLCGGINTFARSKSALQRIEPVVIAISRTRWQHDVPFSFSDNPKFPFDKFAHLNYQHGAYPPTFCLSREDINDWYAEHTLKEYVELVAQWLRDAAKGKLMKITENDEFEPQRIHHIMDHLLMRTSYMDSFLENKKSQCDLYSITILNNYPNMAYGNEQDGDLTSNAIGVRLFAGRDKIDDTWYYRYPETLEQLYNFIHKKDYPLNLEQLKKSLDNNIQFVYFQLALLRPVKIISRNTRINYICFRATASDVLSNNLLAKLEEVTIIDFTDYTAAKDLSATPDSIFMKKICILGCGAVGSKVAFHLYRSGISFLSLVDKDFLLPHNMVRHALSTYKPGSFILHKAFALRKNLEEMFYGMPPCTKSFNEDALLHISTPREEPYELIIDATASSNVMHGLDAIDLPGSPRVVRVALSEGGDVGVTYLAINSRQPLADFYMEILRASMHDDDVYHWLSSERKNSTENIRVGEGCHSNTMRISDDTISAHAALMSSTIRHIYEGEQCNRVILSFAHRDFPGSMKTRSFPVKSYQKFPCANDPSWTVRIPEDLLADIRLKARIAGKNENGAYLFGHIDYKRKVIYPLIHYMPHDSRGSKSGFRLGTSGLKDFKRDIANRSIGQMEYIGDWHSHPACSLDMSAIDITTCRAEVLPQMKEGIGLCVITKTNDTIFYQLTK